MVDVIGLVFWFFVCLSCTGFVLAIMELIKIKNKANLNES